MKQTDPHRSVSKNSTRTPSSRRLRSLVLSWHDEVSGDQLTVNVQGSESFLAGLEPLGFVPVSESSHSSNNPQARRAVSGRTAARSAREASPRSPDAGTQKGGPTDAADAHRVRWTTRLLRHWNLGTR